MDRMTLRNSKMWVLRLFFLNKLAVYCLAKCQYVNELRKQAHAKSHEKTWDLAWHLVRCCASNDLIISK